MTMKGKLNERVSYLNPDVRTRVIDDILTALRTATPFMIATGALAIKAMHSYKEEDQAEQCFATMINSIFENA